MYPESIIAREKDIAIKRRESLGIEKKRRAVKSYYKYLKKSVASIKTNHQED